MSVPFWLVVIVTLALLVWQFRFLASLLMLSLQYLRQPRYGLLSLEQVTPSFLAASADVHEQLLGLGFERLGALSVGSINRSCTRALAAIVYRHPHNQALALVTEMERPTPYAIHQLAFASPLANGQLLYTTDNFAHYLLVPPTDIELQDGNFGDVTQQWTLHFSALNNRRLSGDGGETEAAYNPTPSDLNELVAVIESIAFGFYDHWVKTKTIITWNKDTQTFNPLKLVRFIANLLKTQKAIVQQPANQAPMPSHKMQYLLQRLAEPRARLGGLSAIILFMATMAVFYVSFGWEFSWRLIPTIVLVLLIHELGHYVAMRYFKYQNAQIFIIPFLGAATTGYKKTAVLWQELVVYFAGPVPGVILALALLISGVSRNTSWLSEFTLLCLIINLINLLPMPPLDGGRVAERLLFDQHPKAKAFFYAAGAVGFAFFAWMFNDVFLAAFTVVTSLLAYQQWQVSVAIEEFYGANPEAKNANTLEDVFPAISRLAASTKERIQLGQALKYCVLASKASRVAVATGLCIYAVMLGGGLALTARYVGVLGEVNYNSRAYWEKSLRDYSPEQNPQEYWGMLLEAIDVMAFENDASASQYFYAKAEIFATRWQEPNVHLAQLRLLNAALAHTALTQNDIDFIAHNVFADTEGDLGDKGTIFLQLAESKSSLSPEQRSDLLQKNIQMLTPELEQPYHSLLQRSYHALGLINKKAGNLQEAVYNFKQGFAHELANEFPQYDDLNFNRLIDYYFSQSDFGEAIAITRQRIKAVDEANKKWADEFSETGVYEGSESLPVLQQTLAWLYFLNNDLDLAVPMVDHLALQYLALRQQAADPSLTEEAFDYRHVEFVLDNIIMLNTQKRDAKKYQALLAAIPNDDLAKFKARCQTKKRRPLTAYRYGRYEAVLK